MSLSLMPERPDHEPLVNWTVLAGPGADVAALETHTAALLLTGTTVLKIKKPVQFDFLDFTTRELRLAACEREVALNRRLSPDVYLGVADLSGPNGEPWEHAVVMRRLPADRSLERLVTEKRLPPDAIALIAQRLADFHAAGRRGPDIDQEATVEAVRALWESNLAEIERLTVDPDDRNKLARIGALAHAYLDGRASLWQERLAVGAACDGHGDLQAADIFCLNDGPRILDCIEFDDRYRYGDVVADLAFLTMDLERLGAHQAAVELVEEYALASGGSWPASLLGHYVAYRALVRAKVAAIRASQETSEDLSTADRHRCRGLLRLCLDHLEWSQVLLVLVGGAPGTGKTAFATRLEGRMRSAGWEVRALHSDVIRKELVGLPAVAQPSVPVDTGLYEPARTEITYEAMLAMAGEHLERGISVVLDASWSAAGHREAARRLGQNDHALMVEVECQLDPETAARRIRTRSAEGGDASDATPDVARVLGSRADRWPEATSVDTTGTPNEVADRAWDLLLDRVKSTSPAASPR